MFFVIFPSCPMTPGAPDSDFAAEKQTAEKCGFTTALCHLESLLEGAADAAIARLPVPATPVPCLYRGWMITSEQYAGLAGALTRRGFTPLQPAEAYRKHHEYPGAWAAIPDLMPPSVILHQSQLENLDEAITLAQRTLAGPVLVKDYVKSRKHEWFEACFIPDLADRSAARKVLSTFLTRQGESLCGGIVLRQLLDLQHVGLHPKSQLPIPLEFRTFFLGGEPLCTEAYWHELQYASSVTPPPEFLQEIGRRMGPGFFTADTVLARDGRWFVIETGDGQVSQIPERLPLPLFYARLRERLGF